MRVAFVANTSWNIFNFRKGLVHSFLSNGHDVLILSPKDEYTEKVEGWGVQWIETPLEGTGLNPIEELKYLKRLYDAFKKSKPNVVLSYTIKPNIYSCLAASLISIPVIANVSGLGTIFLVDGFSGKIAKWLYRIAFRKASYVFFQNHDDRELFTTQISLAPSKVGLLPGSGIDLDEFPYESPAFEGPVKFLMISRLIIEKGVQEYAEAAAEFVGDHNVEFTLVGRFDESHSRSIAKSNLNDWIERGYLEYYNHSNEIKELITSHEVVVLPSYREGTPRTLLEAASMGRPLLAADVPGCREVVKNGLNGFLFEVKNARSLESKIRLYLSLSKEERLELSKSSRKLVEEKFNEKLVIDAYHEVIRRITHET